MGKEICEFCCKKRETETTSFVGGYCIDCHEMVIDESQKAIKELRSRK